MKFRRPVPIGKFIADFLCVGHRLIVELDGRPHDDEAQKRMTPRATPGLSNMGIACCGSGTTL
jgi:very-short-patch-repair endonuclease